MVKICRSIIDIKARVKMEIQMFGEVVHISFTNNIFTRAMSLFDKGHTILAVTEGDESENIIFYLKNEKDYLSFGSMRYINVNYEGCDLVSEKDKLDTTLIERADVFIFQQVDEYSLSISNFIKTVYPKKEVYFCDKYAKIFSNQIKLVETIDEIDMDCKRCMYVISEGKPDLSEHVIGTCNILNLMHSLCWARKISHLGPLNRDKTILLIDFEGSKNGLGDIVKITNAYANVAWKHGWIPVVDITGDSQYLDDARDNLWEYYFRPLSDISVMDARNSCRVISLTENNMKMGHVAVTPYIRKEINTFDRRIALADDLIQEFDLRLRDNWKGKKVLGVVARGSDCARGNITEEAVEHLVNMCIQEIEDCNYDAIFLATEEEKYYQAFIKRFNKERLITVPQKRVSYDYKNSKFKLISDLLDIPIGDRRNWGKTYLFITYCLSRCETIYYTISTGAIWLAQKWKANAGGHYEYVNQVGSRQEVIMNELTSYVKFIQSHACVIIWGVGYLTNKLSYIFSKYLNKLVFCDKRAENEKIEFLGVKVIPTAQAIQLAKNSQAGVLVMAADYVSEIEMKLIRLGVEKQNIMKVKRMIAPELDND